MRKVLIALAAAAVLALGAGGSPASADDQGAEWLAAGTGTLMPPPQFGQPMLHVNAKSSYGGANPRGHFWIRYANGGGEFGGEVVCLTVAGNLAWLTGRIDRVKTPRMTGGFVVGNYLSIRLADNGSPGTLDLANFDAGTPVRPSVCNSGVADLPITQGNYVVHDRPANLLGLDLLLGQFEAAADDPYG
jgi:hypothetical protein